MLFPSQDDTLHHFSIVHSYVACKRANGWGHTVIFQNVFRSYLILLPSEESALLPISLSRRCINASQGCIGESGEGT